MILIKCDCSACKYYKNDKEYCTMEKEYKLPTEWCLYWDAPRGDDNDGTD